MKKKHSKYFERIRNEPNSGSWRKKERNSRGRNGTRFGKIISSFQSRNQVGNVGKAAKTF